MFIRTLWHYTIHVISGIKTYKHIEKEQKNKNTYRFNNQRKLSFILPLAIPGVLYLVTSLVLPQLAIANNRIGNSTDSYHQK